jgi:adenylate cyclase
LGSPRRLAVSSAGTKSTAVRPLFVASTRRLVAIMFTDAVGFTASAQFDEAKTLARLHEQESLVRPLLPEYGGREIKSTGDGLLIRFESALRAVQCGIEIQRRLHDRNPDPTPVPMALRIGIHVGDVEELGSDILGDAVNIAARVETAADPGGVCISGPVFAQVRDKLSERFERLEGVSLKGLRAPPDLYRLVLPWSARGAAPPGPERTRIAVLPFANVSAESSEEYFADGLTEELIAELAAAPGLRIIARTSVMRYKGTTKAIREIGEELGVGAVLEGSVRKVEQRIRITAQLIDARTEEHLWSSRYDRNVTDIFAVQAELATSICRALSVEVLHGPRTRRPPPTQNVAAYDAYLRGRHFWWAMGEANFRLAIQHFDRAIALDPSFALAYCGKADCYSLLGNHGLLPLAEALGKAEEAVRIALRLEPNLSEAHTSLAPLLYNRYDWTGAEAELRQAISLDPVNVVAEYWMATALCVLGRTREAITHARRALEMDPLSELVNLQLGWCFYYDRDYEAAIRHCVAIRDAYGFHSRRLLALCRLQQGHPKEAIADLQALLSTGPRRAPLLTVPLAVALSRDGRGPESEALVAEVLGAEAPSRTPPGLIAQMFAGLGRSDESFRWFDQVREQRGIIGVEELRVDPLLDPIRSDPRFGTLLKSFNF